MLITFNGNAQNFEVSPDVIDSITTNNYLIHVSGYATFNDSMVFHVELSDTLDNSFLSFSKDMGDSTDTLTSDFLFNPQDETFSFDIGSFTSSFYKIRLWTEIEGVLNEELRIDTY